MRSHFFQIWVFHSSNLKIRYLSKLSIVFSETSWILRNFFTCTRFWNTLCKPNYYNPKLWTAWDHSRTAMNPRQNLQTSTNFSKFTSLPSSLFSQHAKTSISKLRGERMADAPTIREYLSTSVLSQKLWICSKTVYVKQ